MIFVFPFIQTRVSLTQKKSTLESVVKKMWKLGKMHYRQLQLVHFYLKKNIIVWRRNFTDGISIQ